MKWTAEHLAHGTRLIAMVGLEDVVVVETTTPCWSATAPHPGSKGGRAPHQARRSREAAAHRKVYRPWEPMTRSTTARASREGITVSRGRQLSLQMHHHRAEHWIVVSGTAKVTRGDEVICWPAPEHLHTIGVPIAWRSGQAATGSDRVQSGSYLGEDDIVRFEDVYGRARQ